MRFSSVYRSFFLLAIVPFALLLAYDYVQLSKERMASVKRSLDAMVAIQTDSIEEYLQQASSQVGLVASRTQMRRSLDSYNKLYIAGLNDSEAAISAREKISAILADALGSSPNLLGIRIYGLNKSLVANARSENAVAVGAGVGTGINPYYLKAVYRGRQGPHLLFSRSVELDGAELGRVEVLFSGQDLERIVLRDVGLGSTAETLLASAIGEQAVFLTAVRGNPHAALQARIPLGAVNVPMARVLSGVQEKSHLFQDYSGEAVLASSRMLAGLPWGVVVKVSQKEALKGIVGYSITNLILLVLAAAVVTVLIANKVIKRLNRLSVSVREFVQHHPEIKTERADSKLGDVDRLIADVGILMEHSEQALQRYQKQLADQEQELNIQMAELESAQGELLHSARLASIGELATNVAHEVNQPLTALHMKLQRASKSLQTDDQTGAEQRLAEAFELIQHTRRITENLRRLGRKTGPKKQRVDLHDVIDNAIAVLAEQFKSQGISLQRLLTQHETMVLADPVELGQVLINLLANARDAVTELANKKVEVSLSTDSNHAVIRVTDNGVGVPAERAATIFDGFYSTKDLETGTGVGLTISQKIIHDLGGRIALESSEAGKTVFAVRLPLCHSGKA